MEKPLNQNPLIHIWKTISTSKVLSFSFFEYLKLTDIGPFQVVYSKLMPNYFFLFSPLQTPLLFIPQNSHKAWGEWNKSQRTKAGANFATNNSSFSMRSNTSP